MHKTKAHHHWLRLVGMALIGVLAYIYIPLPFWGIDQGKRSGSQSSVQLTDAELWEATTTHRALPPPPPTGKERALAQLGRQLFFDSRLSRNAQIACSTCHNPDLAFTDGRRLSLGLSIGDKNAPSLANVYLATWFFWDGRADSLAAQALQPIENPDEHGISRIFVMQHLRQHYRSSYEAIFGAFPTAPHEGIEEVKNNGDKDRGLQLSQEVAAYSLATLGSFKLLNSVLSEAQKKGLAPIAEINQRAFPTQQAPHKTDKAIDQVFFNFGLALAAYQRGLVAIDSPFDAFAQRWQKDTAPETALTADFGPQELSGLRLFTGKARCSLCHTGPLFSDQQFHNIGLPQETEQLEIGRASGVLRVQQNNFNCGSTHAQADKQLTEQESCRELPYLDANNFELVGAFKTPSLRNVAKTAPYMHDGRFSDLQAVLHHYNLLEDKPSIGHREESLQALQLNREELLDLEAFLRSLTSEIKDLTPK